MNEIEITREFLDENAEEVKNWDMAAEVVFTAWVDKELADKAESRIMRRANNWHAKHADTYILKEARIEAYNGEIIVSSTVRKLSSDN